jgi:hypothetical protein
MKRALWFHSAALGIAASVGAILMQQSSAGADFERPVRLKAGDQYIDTGQYTAHAGPLVADINNDGKNDLLVGNFGGHFQIYLNTSTNNEPQYQDKGLLTVDQQAVKVPNW